MSLISRRRALLSPIFYMVFLLSFIACNNQSNMVMPGTDGINRITIRSSDDPQSLIKRATLTAQLYCKSAKKHFRAIGREIFDRDKLKQQQIYNENLQHYPMPNEGYLEFTCL